MNVHADTPTSDRTTRPSIERRLAAASCDALVVGACCALLFFCFGPIWKTPSVWVWAPASIVLLICFTLEALTGITLGKRLAGLSLRRADGSAPGTASLILRATIKFLPVALFVGVLFPGDGLAGVMTQWAAILLVIVYGQVCYILLMRDVGRTMFDLAAGTIVHARAAPPTSTQTS